MHFQKTAIPEVVLIQPDVPSDSRGHFREVFHAQKFLQEGIDLAGAGGPSFVQLNHSRSIKGTLRGLHYQEPHGQGKLVWVISGTVLDVAVDIREGSPTFGQWSKAELSDQNNQAMWIPVGFAHGFLVLSDAADVMYACTDVYSPDCERSVRWDDPQVGIPWGAHEPLLSDKDANAPLLTEVSPLPAYQGRS